MYGVAIFTLGGDIVWTPSNHKATEARELSVGDGEHNKICVRRGIDKQ